MHRSLLFVVCAVASAAPTRRAAGARQLGFCWSCEHGARSWWFWEDCKCDDGYTGGCCDEPETCSASSDAMCPQSRLIEHSAQCSSAFDGNSVRVGTKEMGLPPSMQGIFWLTEQGDSSALMSFATSDDGDGLSQLNMEKESQMKIRVGGDRTWAFHAKANSWMLVDWLDLIYKFRFEDADGNAPSSADQAVAAQIIPSSANAGDLSLTATSILNFRAELAPAGSHSKYADSVVWGRPSSVFGFEGGYYDLVQVVDGNGQRIEPAFSDFVKYCGDQDETGNAPGTMFYRKAE